MNTIEELIEIVNDNENDECMKKGSECEDEVRIEEENVMITEAHPVRAESWAASGTSNVVKKKTKNKKK